MCNITFKRQTPGEDISVDYNACDAEGVNQLSWKAPKSYDEHLAEALASFSAQVGAGFLEFGFLSEFKA